MEEFNIDDSATVDIEELVRPKKVIPTTENYTSKMYKTEANSSIIKPKENVGDFSNDFLSQQRQQVEPIPKIMSFVDKRKQEFEQAKSIENKNFQEQFSAFIKQAGKDNLGAAITEWGATKWYTDFKPDPNFKKTDSEVFDALKMNGLGFDSFSALKSAKSKKEYDFELIRQRRKVREDEEIRMSLGKKNQMFASVLGAIGDVDMVGGLAISKLYKTEKVMRLATAETAYEVGLASARMNFNEHYSSSNFLIDISFGFAANMGVAKVLGHIQTNRLDVPVDNNNIPKPSVKTSVDSDGMIKIETNSETLDIIEKGNAKTRKARAEAERQRIFAQEQIEGTPEYIAKKEREIAVRTKIYKAMGFSDAKIAKLIEKDFGLNKEPSWLEANRLSQSNKDKKINEINKKIEALDEEFPIEVKKSKEAQKKYDDLAEERQKAFDERRALEVEEKRMEEVEEEVLARQREEEIIRKDQQEQNRLLAEKFKDKKYETSNSNRKTFFEHQRKMNQDKVSPKINEINLLMAKATKAITKARNELKKLIKEGGSKLKIANREKKIATLQKEIDGHKASIKELTPKVGVLGDNLKYIMRVVDDMMEDMVDSSKRLLEELKNTSIDGITDDMIAVIDEFYRRNPEIAKEIKDLLGSKLGNRVIKKEIKLEDIKASKKLSKKTKTMIIAAALSGTVASASEGDEISTESVALVGFLAVVLLGAGGLRHIIKYAENPEIIAPIKRFTDSVKNSYKKSAKNVSPEASKARHYSSWLADISHTRLSSAIAPLLKVGGKVEEFSKKLFFAHNGGDGLAFLGDGWRRASVAKYNIAEKSQFDNWLIEKEVKGFVNKIKDEEELILEFRQLVSDNMRKRNSTSKAIIKMCEEQDEIYKEIFDRAKEYGVKGFENIKYEVGKLPRLWNSGNIYKLLHGADDASVQAFEDALFEGVLKANGGNIKKARATAASLTKHFKTRVVSSDSSTENIYDLVESLLKDDVSAKDFNEAMETVVDTSGRARNRVPLDIDSIPDFEMNINGVKTPITKSMLVENDSLQLLELFSNEMSGLSALAKGNFKTVASAKKFIEKNFPPELQARGEALLDMMLGRPVKGSERGAVNDIINSMKDITIAEKLNFVIFSVPYELFKTITNGGYAKSIKNLIKMSSKTMSENERARLIQLIENTSSGTNVLRSRSAMSSRIIEGADGSMEGASMLRQATNKIAVKAMLYNGLSSFTDIMQKVNLLANEERLAKYIKTKKGITKGRADTYNIKDSDFDRFKDDFVFDSNGELQVVDQTNWSITKKDDYANILRRMGMEQVLEHTHGESPLWSATSTAGKLLSTLVGYPILMHNNHFQNGMRQLDSAFLSDNILAFGGSYLGYQAKYALLDKEVEDEQIAVYALMNTLPMSLLSSITSMTDSPVLQVMQTATNVIDPVEWERKQ